MPLLRSAEPQSTGTDGSQIDARTHGSRESARPRSAPDPRGTSRRLRRRRRPAASTRPLASRVGPGRASSSGIGLRRSGVVELAAGVDRLHPDQIDHTHESVLGADRQLHRYGTGAEPLVICATTPAKSAPTRSILLMKAIARDLNLSAWCQTVSDCGSTPPTPQKTTTAPSSTRRLRSTSIVKSTWPGCVDQMDLVPVPVERGRRRGDGDAALALLRHPVHLRLTVVDFAHACGSLRCGAGTAR